MKLKEFSITRYGPLPNTGRILLDNFNLFFGKNEDGKTLTIDALVKLLLGKKVKDFKKLDRVKESPEGYVVIEDGNGREMKLTRGKNLTKVTDLTPSECRNIFIIRNSDVFISPESEFYTNVTERLTGLRTKEILKIKEILREMGKITPGGTFRDVKDEKLKTRMEGAKELIEGIDMLAENLRENKFDELEEDLVRKKKRIDELIQEIDDLEEARKREKYDKGENALNKLKEALGKFNNLEVYNETDQQSWRYHEKDIQGGNEGKKVLLDKLKENEGELSKISEKLEEREREFRILEERKKKLDDETKPELKIYEREGERLARKKAKSRFFIVTGIISLVLLGVSLIGAVISPSLLFYILTVLFLVLTALLWGLKFQFIREKAHLAGTFERIKLTLSKFEMSAENIKEIFFNIQKFDEEYQKKTAELQDIRRKEDSQQIKITGLQDERIPEIEKKIEDNKEKIDKIKTKSKEESLEEYTKKLDLKKSCEKSLGEQKSILKSFFGTNGKIEKESITYWDGKIKELKEYQNKAKDISYDESAAFRLKEEEKLCQEELSGIEEKMTYFQDSLEAIERKVNRILQLEEDYLHCKISVDLDTVKDRLQDFIHENEDNKNSVLNSIKIFEEIEKEERGKISTLFDKGSSVSRYFYEITNGLYEEVSLNQETYKIEVKRKDGTLLEAEKLSGGAWDQLYLSIRLSLGEKILKDGKGFFIMDDPFIKADFLRLQKQMEMLKKISESGWQIIYFSAKEEIKDALKKDIKKGVINYIEVQSPLF